MMIFIAESDVRCLLDPAELIVAIENAFRDRYPSIRISPRPLLQLGNGIFLTMSCYDPSVPALGMKLVTVRKTSGAGGGVSATYLLLDPETAEPRLTIAANYLTDLRTAATSAVATKFLARPDATTLAIFGTGRLALAHLAVLPLARNFKRVLICGRDPERSLQFIDRVSTESAKTESTSTELNKAELNKAELNKAELNKIDKLEISAADARACAAEADVICTCSSSLTPLFDGRDLRPGTHLNLVGAFQPHTREADTLTIQRALVVVDTYEAAKTEAGELRIPMEEGAIQPGHVIADLHDLVSGKKQGRRSAEDITAFKSVGCALEDLVAAELILGRCGAETPPRRS
jgi:ornithine cyclodeaminase/alanine dehydrogenase-like protein (mu-crystallin family)